MAEDSEITAPWDDDPDAILLTQGRPEPVQPYTKLGDWLAFSGVSAQASVLYWIYRMHVNHLRALGGDTKVWAKRRELARMLGLANASGVDPYNRQLVAVNAIDIVPRFGANGGRRTNEYVIHMAPPDGYTGPQSLADVYAILRAGGELPQRTKPTARPKKPTANP